MLAPETVLQNRYRVHQELGRGGMGAVYEAFDLRLRRPVALKETLAQTEELHRAFRQEARLLANLRHPSLPNVLDHFTEGDGHFLVMEYIAGPDLAQMLARRAGAPFPVRQVLKWADEILSVLEYLHGNNPAIVHRDIKPANLKPGPNGQIILLDFGLAKGAAGGMTDSLMSKSVRGYSPHYAPLEQTYGERSDPRSDLYAVAATLYHLLTGRVPEEAAKRASVLIAEDRDPLPLAHHLNREVPVELSEALARALSLKLHERPASASVMKAMLNRILAPTPTETTLLRPRSTPPAEPGSDTIYQTIQGKPELVPNPFAVAPSAHTTATTPSRGRWVFSGFLVVALVVGLYLLLISRQSTKSDLSSTTMASLPAKPLIPSPYREALGSVVLLEMRDAEGTFLGHASGFFVEKDEIATDLGIISGASKGVVSVVNQGAVYEVSGVAGVDRERGIALLKVEGGEGKPLRVAANAQTASGSKVALLSSSANAQGDYAPATITAYQKSDDLLEIGSTVAASARGGPVLNERGEVVGMLVGANEGVTAAHAVTSTRLVNVMKRQQQQTALGVAGAKDVLYDFRQSNDTTKETKISTEVERKVLNAVFKSYLTDSSGCEGYEGDSSSPEGLKRTRDSGYIVPAISASANGSFTGPGLQQTAYLIMVGECGAPHAVNWGTKRLAVFTGQTLVVNVDVGDHPGIVATYDLNKDGVNELLLTGAYMQSGYFSEWAALVSVMDAKLRYLKKFETVRNDDCGSMETRPSVTAAVIYYTAGTTETQFRVDNYQAKCTEEGESPKPSAFKYVSSGKLPKS